MNPMQPIADIEPIKGTLFFQWAVLRAEFRLLGYNVAKALRLSK